MLFRSNLITNLPLFKCVVCVCDDKKIAIPWDTLLSTLLLYYSTLAAGCWLVSSHCPLTRLTGNCCPLSTVHWLCPQRLSTLCQSVYTGHGIDTDYYLGLGDSTTVHVVDKNYTVLSLDPGE